MPLLPPLASPQDVAAVLDDPRIRVFDTTVVLDRPAGGGPYTPIPQRDAYRREHVPGAEFADLVDDLVDPDAPFPFAVPTPERFAEQAGALGIGDDVHVVAYAQESPMWATRLWWLLRYFGFDAVSVLDGGLPAWKAAGLPLETGEQTFPVATFTPRPRPELLATRADVEAVVADGGGCLLNALPPKVFRGEGPSSYSRPGRIPGSVSVPAASLLDDATGRFRPASDLQEALSAGGVPEDQPLVAYCGGGISATVDLFALSLVGRDDAKLYDGSLTEWTADPTLPVEVG
ncbi:MAG: sulfurtransferase [Patulibacter sp.]|nr:sulfurtransferase [Patulibacter sp.]